MANHKSAKKRARQDIVRRDRNRQVLSRVRTVVKGVRQAVDQGDAEAARKSLRAAERELRKAATKGVLPARRVSRSVLRKEPPGSTRPMRKAVFSAWSSP